MSTPAPDSDRFAALYDGFATRVYAYARRHCEASVAEDIVAETFLVAWRRFADVPPDPMPWLLVVARNVIANHRRTVRRRDEAYTDGIERVMATHAAVDDVVIGRETVLHALASLTDIEREAVLLVGWDGLSARDAATVAGCSQRAFDVRLHRARRRLARALDTAPTASPAPSPQRPRRLFVEETS